MMQAKWKNNGAIWKLALGLVGATGLLLAQGQRAPQGQTQGGRGQAAPQGQAAQGAAPAAPAGPRVKSNPEAQALMAAFNAQNADARIQAGQAFVTQFPDSDFKGTVLYLIGASYQEKGDIENTISYLERCVQAEPKNYQALIMLGRVVAMRTRDTDLDKEEKLTSAEKYANQAAEVLKTAPKPNENLPDADWEAAKKDMNAQVYETLGVAAFVRGKYDEAIVDLKKSLDAAANQDPSTAVRLANVYSKAGKFDDGISVIDKVLAMPELDARVKQIAQAQKADMVKLKGGQAK